LRRENSEKEIDTAVNHIQQNYPGALVYLERNLSKLERLALWSESNCLLITTLRDGQCIPPLEYIAVKKIEKKLSKATVILSEFSGCNRALCGILKINPFNVEEITKNIDVAIQMSPGERQQRLETAYSFISQGSTQKWAAGFLSDLKRNTVQLRSTEFYSQTKFMGLGLQRTLIRT
jgi:trehalose-6-phosphate synthase